MDPDPTNKDNERHRVADSLDVPSKNADAPQHQQPVEPSKDITAPTHQQSVGPKDIAASERHQPAEPELKATKKQMVLRELKDVISIVLYLAGSLSILATYKSLILLQQGVNEFVHNYTFAILEAIALGKIVALAQHLPFLHALRNRVLILVVLYQSLLMTLVIDLGGQLEDHLFPQFAKLLAQSGNPVAFAITHQLASMMIFIVLFSVRGVDTALGKGKLRKLFFETPASKIEQL